MRNYNYIDSLSLDKKINLVKRFYKRSYRVGSAPLIKRARDLKSRVIWGIFEGIGEL